MTNLAYLPGYRPDPQPVRRGGVNSWRWNEFEDEALQKLPPEIERLYMRGIRKHMDYATGITGRKRRVSMQMFANILEYHPPAGSREKARTYSRQQVTRMLDKLEAAGLIKRLHRGKGVKAPMEFRLPLACSDIDGGASQTNPHGRASGEGNTEQRQHRANSEPRGQSQTNPHGRASGEGNTEQGASKEERATSGSPFITSSYEEESTAGADDAPPVDQDLLGNDPQPEQPPPKAKRATLPNCPHGEILDLWAEIMPDKTQPVRSLWGGSARAQCLAARWKAGFTILREQTGKPLYTDLISGLDWWGRFFQFLRLSEFLMRDDSRWFGLDWIVKAANFEKILSMKYHEGDS